MQNGFFNKKFVWLTAFSVALITFIVYIPALKNDFVNWDDQEYVYENRNIQSIDSKFLKWVISSEVAALWHPLTLLSLALDYLIWGLNPLGYHLTNNLFHAANTFLVFILFVRLIEKGTANLYQVKIQSEKPDSLQTERTFVASFITALLFGLHPLRVESVAWISGRKDVLYAFFFLLTLIAYLKYTSTTTKRKKTIYYVLSLALFILAITSKPTAVSLPIVLLIFDLYPLNRLSTINEVKGAILEKIPFIILSVVISYITMMAQRNALIPLEMYPLEMRISNIVQAYGLYLVKMILPFNFAPIYPVTKIRFLTTEFICSFGLLITFTLFSIFVFKRKKLFLSVWLYYISTLIPVIGLVKVGGHAMADRYTYLPSLGPFLLAGMWIANLFVTSSKKLHRRVLILLVLVLMIGFLAKGTYRQITIWQDSITLWSHQIKLFPRTARAYSNRGNAYYSTGNYNRALLDFNKVIEIYPRHEYYNRRGLTYKMLGRNQEALLDYTKAIEINQQYELSYNNRGNVYQALGNYNAALNDYNAAIKINPKYMAAYYNRGNMYYKMGNYQRAIKDYNAAVMLDPEDAKAGEMLRKLGVIR